MRQFSNAIARPCLSLLVLGGWFALAPAHAAIFRCVDPAGDVSYRDSPCPDSASMSANITDAVQACVTPECQAQLEQARASAEERLRAERAVLTEMQERRMRTEALDLQRRLQQQQERMQSLEAELHAQRTADSGVYFPGYPLFPGAFDIDRGRGDRYWLTGKRPCVGAQCTPRPGGAGVKRRHHREPVVNVIAPGPFRRHR